MDSDMLIKELKGKTAFWNRMHPSVWTAFTEVQGYFQVEESDTKFPVNVAISAYERGFIDWRPRFGSIQIKLKEDQWTQ